MSTERRGIELRALDPGSPRTVSGTAVRYGDTATIGGQFLERVVPGAFRLAPTVMLNIQHRREMPVARTGAGLELEDGSGSLEFRALLPETRLADDLLEGIRAGLFRGASVEMNVRSDEWTAGARPLRTIRSAMLHAIAIVDDPAYPDSGLQPETRAAFERGLATLAPVRLWR